MDHKRNAAKRSLVLITVDCLRADHCGFYGYSHPTTPFLDSLAAESVVVPAAIVSGAPTYYSLPGIAASRMPMALGRDVLGLAPEERTLATTLRDSGYATAAFSAGNPYITARFGYDQGFDTFRDFADFETQRAQMERNAFSPGAQDTGKEPSPYLSTRRKLNLAIKGLASAIGLAPLYDDLYFQYCMKIAPEVTDMDALRKYPAADILVEQAESWLASIGPSPFFLWLHLMDPHAPYYPPTEAYRELTGRDIYPARARYVNEYWNRFNLPASRLEGKREEVVQLYDAGIRWVDRQIARLVGALMRLDAWDDCVFALTADHGEEFLEHGGRFHAPVHLCEEIVRVPLLIRVPKGLLPEEGAAVPSSPLSLLHLAPTLLDIMSVSVPSSFRGRSLWTNLRQGTSWSDPAIIECAYGCTNPFRTDNRFVPRLLGVRDVRFKLVMLMEPGAREEMYDLETDPAETRPVSTGSIQGKRKELLLAAREHIRPTPGEQDGELHLRSSLRDLRAELLSDDILG